MKCISQVSVMVVESRGIEESFIEKSDIKNDTWSE